MPAFDDLWNYNEPALTELKFRELLPEAEQSSDAEYLAELLTQIARAEGLQQKFEDAHRTLNRVDGLLTSHMKTAPVRSALERGRVLNSSGQRQKSVDYFKQALVLADASGLEFHAVDAAHMLGIVTPSSESLQWNEEAIRRSEGARDPRARRWLGSLYNNTGWTYFDMEQYGDALRMFEKDMELFSSEGKRTELGIARWSAAKVLRHLGRVAEALEVQKELLGWPELQGGSNEGYTHEEIGECLNHLGLTSEASPHFARAWELLRMDPWLSRDEPARLERLKQLGRLPDQAEDSA
jgi:tetratricopeptide (TPR) repeat protein